MRKPVHYYCLLLMLCSAWACSYRTEKIEEVEPVNPPNMLCPDKASTKEDQGEIAFEFRLMNTKGQVTNCFKEGEDVLFQVLAINQSDTALTWGDHYDDYETGYVFQVYQKDSEGINRLISNPVKGIFCTKRLNTHIREKDTVKMFTSWGNTVDAIYSRSTVSLYSKNHQCYWKSLSGDNRPLKRGHYEVAFNFQITLTSKIVVKNNPLSYELIDIGKVPKKINTTLSFQVN
jgi:hypothetical protein